ncbi:glycosyltransferase family 4 protein [Geomesophilobacter sediminis]|uniref:Glycosyltransferase family 4 protein n=1 Tax=Geomesophilobacter sediminis TaxID=2798584 RepID=A0A8J7LWL2_9BACT|nr:glycosyltransferase family 4 protein [Geomesophilobacter sediminis]MBJ6725950.1 glycosyltransferase family 4 protein [Geomesophilobacter sediminis]
MGATGAGKRFVVIFEPLQSVHLHKDVGQVPYQLFKHYGYRSEIVCRKNETHYQYLDRDLKGLTLTFLKSSPLRYLLGEAKDIDVLMLFHITTKTIYAGILYKLLNPRGTLYVKYDLSDDEILYATWGHRNFFTQLKRNFLFSRLLRYLDLFSAESRGVYRKITKIPPQKKLHIPNGFDPDLPVRYGVVPKPFGAKENVILLVGRHGSREKNSELVLGALELIRDIGDWEVHFVGPMTEEFVATKEDFLERHPWYRGKVHFPGSISDKKVLFEYYNRAKIFCLPSRWESWGLVCVEALSFGNVLVMSQGIVSAPDLTDDGRVGFMVEGEDAASWAKMITSLMANQDLLAERSRTAARHFQENFEWKKVLEVLNDRIESLVHTRDADAP